MQEIRLYCVIEFNINLQVKRKLLLSKDVSSVIGLASTHVQNAPVHFLKSSSLLHQTCRKLRQDSTHCISDPLGNQ